MLDFVCQDHYSLDDFVRLISYLRSERGCPWDRVQTHESIRRNFLEEAYEACEAIDEGDPAHLREELGDVDVADAACKKLVSRHPHVFGTAAERAAGADWEGVKRRERGQHSTAESMDSVSRALPSLWRCEKIQAKAAKVGFDWPDTETAFQKLPEETEELRAAISRADADAVEEELGDLLFAIVKIARFQGVDPERAAHRACEKFMRRFAAVEAAAGQGEALSRLSRDEMIALYARVKAQEHAPAISEQDICTD